MKKFISYFLVVMLIPALVLTGCKDDDDPVPVETGNYETLATYMINQNFDLPALLDTWIIDPLLIDGDVGIVDPVDYSIPGWTVFDIRSAASFAEGHIKGSVNVALENVVTVANEINDNTTKILVVCYTGQTAGRAVMALRLSGFPNAAVSKFGFSGWSADAAFDSWTANTSDRAVGSPNWVTTAAPALDIYASPEWTTTSTDGATILADKVTEMLAVTTWGATAVDVLASPNTWTIYNNWTDDDGYITFGHFAGAFQYKPIAFDNVNNLNPESNNIVYCFTGQTSSFEIAWLQVLGYNTQSVLFGANNLKYQELSDAGKPHWHFPYHSYEYVVGE
jgi:rhodanese-related sulfurtransferase